MPRNFIVLEGIDGSGTTTQRGLLANLLQLSYGVSVVETCEPTTGPIGKLIRKGLGNNWDAESGKPRPIDGNSLALLFAADRLDHIQSVVVPALERNAVVISDRYVLSSLCYQTLANPNPDKESVLVWLREINSKALQPDLTIVVTVSAEVASKRRAKRGGTKEIFEYDELQCQLAKYYARAQELLPGQNVVFVDGGKPQDQVLQEIHEKLVVNLAL